MLQETSISIALSNQVMIGEKVALTLNATIPSQTKIGNVTQYVADEVLYEANKAECRRDTNSFRDMVYSIEDNYPVLTVPEA